MHRLTFCDCEVNYTIGWGYASDHRGLSRAILSDLVTKGCVVPAETSNGCRWFRSPSDTGKYESSRSRRVIYGLRPDQIRSDQIKSKMDPLLSPEQSHTLLTYRRRQKKQK